jgi:alginate O-acetyltransferase complex protein AlgI
MINFSDLSFIFRFLPIFLIIYYAVPYRFRSIVLSVGSLVFYAIGDIRSLGIFAASVVVNYLLSLQCLAKKKKFLYLSVLLDAGVLMAFKLLVQFGQVSVLPLGISFFTFKMISYQADCYKGLIKKRPAFFSALAYFSLFPQVISGPIMRYDYYEKNEAISGKKEMFLLFRDRLPMYLCRIESGLFWFSLGFGMKILIADYMAMMWNEIGTIGYESISTPLAWLGAVCYSLNLYFDFWGYSLMAAGVGVALGFPFVQNFNHPYAAGSVSDFYRRWHMTLGSWFKDYVYIPFGGSKKGTKRTVFNLFVVWLFTGIWHGITPNFFIWSGTLLLLILAEKFILSGKKGLMAVVGRINVLVLVPLTWVVFALSSFTDIANYFSRLFPFFGGGVAVNPGDFAKFTDRYGVFLIAGLVLLIPCFFEFVKENRKSPVIKILIFALFVACACISSTKAGNPFLYFNF